MYTIALYHKHFDKNHLTEVKEKMLKLGRPKIRAIYSENLDMWLAVEGCHRLRACQDLNILPIIIDISNNKTVTIQSHDEKVKFNITTLKNELETEAYKTELINFDGE